MFCCSFKLSPYLLVAVTTNSYCRSFLSMTTYWRMETSWMTGGLFSLPKQILAFIVLPMGTWGLVSRFCGFTAAQCVLADAAILNFQFDSWLAENSRWPSWIWKTIAVLWTTDKHPNSLVYKEVYGTEVSFWGYFRSVRTGIKANTIRQKKTVIGIKMFAKDADDTTVFVSDL